jgi:2-oxoglutarate dehydrogenase E2 component (dihydrolipoamide succinyltransferase)
MLIEVKVPQLPESVSEATLLGWNKKMGEAVERDETLVGLETDKVVLDIPAPQAGVLVNIAFNEGDTVTNGQVIATIDTAATKSAELKETAPAQQQVSTPPSVTQMAMPAAKKLADENQLNVADIPGTGRGGRVLKEDVAAHLQAPAAAAQPNNAAAKPSNTAIATTAAVPHKEARPEQRVPMSRLRLRVAERLLESQHNNAILTTFNEVNMKPVMDLRAKYKEKFEKEYGVKLGFMGFFIKAAVAALKRYPVVNASVDGSDIIYHGYYDIGVAVGSPRGLVVPVIRNADLLTLAEIEKQIADFGARAQAGKLTMEELTGGTYTISNGGTFGSMMSTPIINPPQSAILGMHATKERAVVENGQVVVRPMMYLAQSYDHRIIDGREAVLSLVAIKEAIEDPLRLVLEI